MNISVKWSCGCIKKEVVTCCNGNLDCGELIGNYNLKKPISVHKSVSQLSYVAHSDFEFMMHDPSLHICYAPLHLTDSIAKFMVLKGDPHLGVTCLHRYGKWDSVDGPVFCGPVMPYISWKRPGLSDRSLR